MRNLILAAALMPWGAAGFCADPPPPPPPASVADSIKTWFQHWKDGLSASAVEGQYQQKSLTAVAAVRGKKQSLDNPNRPYIKGTLEAQQEARVKKERAELGQAVELILGGKPDEGLKKLDEFEVKHPKSPLRGDVQKAREKLKELRSIPS